jgi:hypothetical protein
MKRMVALGVLLVIGIIALWPRGGSVIEAPSLEEPTGSTAGGGAVTAGPARGLQSMHAKLMRPAASVSAHEDERARIDAEWDIAPEPKLVEGPSGKVGLMEGATKLEVVATWGQPTEIIPPGSIFFDSASRRMTELRQLEEWVYMVGNARHLVWFDESERLSGTPLSPLDMKRFGLDSQRGLWDFLDHIGQ